MDNNLLKCLIYFPLYCNFYPAELQPAASTLWGFFVVYGVRVCTSGGITGDVCLMPSLVAQSDCSKLGSEFPEGFFPPAVAQDMQLSHAETAVGRRDCLENPSILLLPFGILCKPFERAAM